MVAHFLLSFMFLKTTFWKRFAVILIFSIFSGLVGFYTLLHFAFNEKPDPADLYGLIAFLLVMFICYEVLAKVNRKLFR
jgi:hypothetical protein